MTLIYSSRSLFQVIIIGSWKGTWSKLNQLVLLLEFFLLDFPGKLPSSPEILFLSVVIFPVILYVSWIPRWFSMFPLDIHILVQSPPYCIGVGLCDTWVYSSCDGVCLFVCFVVVFDTWSWKLPIPKWNQQDLVIDWIFSCKRTQSF